MKMSKFEKACKLQIVEVRLAFMRKQINNVVASKYVSALENLIRLQKAGL